MDQGQLKINDLTWTRQACPLPVNTLFWPVSQRCSALPLEMAVADLLYWILTRPPLLSLNHLHMFISCTGLNLRVIWILLETSDFYIQNKSYMMILTNVGVAEFEVLIIWSSWNSTHDPHLNLLIPLFPLSDMHPVGPCQRLHISVVSCKCLNMIFTLCFLWKHVLVKFVRIMQKLVKWA